MLSPAFALMALLVARAKRSVRAGTGGRSVEAQDVFRRTTSMLFAGTALFTCLLLTLLSMQSLRVALGERESLGVGFLWACVAMIVFALAGLIRILRVSGQGGALLEDGSAEAPLTGGLADNRHWFLGVIYVDRGDPSLLVESRFGIGYTLNLGNRTAVLFLASYVTLVAILLGLALSGTVQ